MFIRCETQNCLNSSEVDSEPASAQILSISIYPYASTMRKVALYSLMACTTLSVDLFGRPYIIEKRN
jgi:hypothetical protein